MSVNIDYSFYVGEYDGYLSELEFSHVLQDAKRHVAWMCDGRSPKRCELHPYKRAICAVCEVFAEYGHGPVREYALGSFRVDVAGSGATGQPVTGDEMATQAVQMELCTTSLLFGGVC